MILTNKPQIKKLETLGDLYSSEHLKPSQVIVKFKITVNNHPTAVWFPFEYNALDSICFGWCRVLHGCGELGYFSIAEISEVSDEDFSVEETEEMTLTKIKNIYL